MQTSIFFLYHQLYYGVSVHLLHLLVEETGVHGENLQLTTLVVKDVDVNPATIPALEY
jgi:hypothetical protein